MKRFAIPALLSLMIFLGGCSQEQLPSPAGRLSSRSSATGNDNLPVAAPGISRGSRLPSPATAPQILAVSAILIDARTGRTLYEKNADEPRQVASTQKLVTALLVAESDPLESPVTVGREDVSVEPTRIGLHPGESYPRRQLLRAMMVHSANDCASALARGHSGSLARFAEEMNGLAGQCGATRSHFANPHGLPAPQHSTARDMARIAFRAYRNPDLRDAMALRSYCFRYANGRFCDLEPTNRLLLRSPYFNGMKTGYTEAAGKCLVSSYSKGGRELILVQLGSHAPRIFDDAQRMMLWAAP